MSAIEPAPAPYIGRIIHSFSMDDLKKVCRRYLEEVMGVEVVASEVMLAEEVYQTWFSSEELLKFTVVPPAGRPVLMAEAVEVPVPQLAEPAPAVVEEKPESQKLSRSEAQKLSWERRRAKATEVREEVTAGSDAGPFPV
jgi:hypothetical protein